MPCGPVCGVLGADAERHGGADRPAYAAGAAPVSEVVRLLLPAPFAEDALGHVQLDGRRVIETPRVLGAAQRSAETHCGQPGTMKAE